VDVFYPTDPSTGMQAGGRFAVIVTETPYVKYFDHSNALAQGLGAGSSSYLVERGYIQWSRTSGALASPAACSASSASVRRRTGPS